MSTYRVMGEKRGFLKEGAVLMDSNMELDEAHEMIKDLKKEMPLWNFWVEKQGFNDEEV